MLNKLREKLSKIIEEIYNQAWTIAGTVLVLITLSGDVQEWGIKISLITLGIHLLGVVVRKSKEDDQEST